MSARTPGPAEAPRLSPKGAAAVVLEPRVVAAQAEIALLVAEADAAPEKSAAALLHFEAGHLQESELADVKAASRSYKNALAADPSFQLTAWALRRQLTSLQQWENLLRVLEAEARFASSLPAEDCSDLLLERGWVLREHLGRVDEAHASLAEAVQVNPSNLAAWLALLLHALASGAATEARAAFDGLVTRAQRLDGLVAWSSAYAWWLLLPQTQDALALDGVAATQAAAAVLFSALDAGADDPFILGTLDRLSLQPRHAALRPFVLDRLVLAHGQDERRAHALASRLLAMRERARRRAAEGDLAGAGAELDAALALAPEHPLAAADRLELAMLQADRETFGHWQSQAADPLIEAELILRRVDGALRQAAWGEAIALLDTVAPELDLQDLCFVERVRALAGLADPQGLAQAYEAQAETTWARCCAVVDPPPKDVAEAAHLFVRAGAIWEVELADSLHAEALYGQALALVPTYRPALEGLASIFTREGRWDSLAQLVAEDASAAATPERASALRESLVLLNRDVLGDVPAALAAQKALVQASPQDARGLFRWLDLAARMASSQDAALDDAVEAITRLSKVTKSSSAKAALAVLAARMLQVGGRIEAADAWLERAVISEPRTLAVAFIERSQTLDAMRAAAALHGELNAWARDPHGQSHVRALRFRQAFRALEAGGSALAVAELEPLCHADEVARRWKWDITRRSREPQLMRRVLALAADAASTPSQDVAAELAVVLGESLELAGRRQDAAAAYSQTLLAAKSLPQPELMVRAGLGRLRVAAALNDLPGVVAALGALAAALPTGFAEAFAREAEYVLWAIGGATTKPPDLQEPVLACLAALSASANGFADQLKRFAGAVPAGEARSDLSSVLGLLSLVQGWPDAQQLLQAAHEENGAADVEVALTELPGVSHAANNEGVVLARLRRLTQDADAHDEASAALASLLALELAALAESQGRLAAAATAYHQVLQWRAGSLEALEGLRRLAQLAGARTEEAFLLERIADTLVNAKAAAEHYAEAALLFEAEGNGADAVRLFYKVLSRAPKDDEAFDRLLALLRQSQQWERVDRLLGFKLTHLSQAAPRCVPLWLERARIRFTHLGDTEGAIEDWRRILAVDASIFEAHWRLGQETRSRGAREAARIRFEAALKCSTSDTTARVVCLMDLAEVYALRSDLQTAATHLRAAKQLLPHIPLELHALVDRLESLSARTQCADVAITALETLAAATSGAKRAAYLVRVGRILRDSQAPGFPRPLAAQAFMRALEADPFCDGAQELSALWAAGPQPSLTQKQNQLLTAAFKQVLEHVCKHALFEVRGVEAVYAYAYLLKQPWRQVMAGQLLFLLGQGNMRGQARDVRGSLALNELFALGGQGPVSAEALALQAAWPMVQDSAGKAWLAAAPPPALGRGTRTSSREEPRLAWVEAAARALGLQELAVHQVAGAAPVWVAGGTPPVLILGPASLGGDPAIRFRVARALALLRLGMPFAVNQSDVAAVQWAIAALAVISESHTLAAASSLKLRQSLQHAFPRRALRASEPFKAHMAGLTANDIEAWVCQGLRAAARFALVVSGDLAESVFTLAGGRQVETVRISEPARALVRFALSDDCGRLLSRCGLESFERNDV